MDNGTRAIGYVLFDQAIVLHITLIYLFLVLIFGNCFQQIRKTHCHLIGYQSPMDRALKIQNVGAVPPSRGNTQPVELCPDQKYGGLSASSLGSMRLDQAMVGHPAADVQNFNRAQYGRTNGADVQKDLPAVSN